jgi:hypothetical protein
LIVDFTPSLERTTASGFKVPADRGVEIQAWLDDHPRVQRFVILDDLAGMAHLSGHLVQTESRTGLTQELADEVVRRMKGEGSQG